jgi:hypothetical protein
MTNSSRTGIARKGSRRRDGSSPLLKPLPPPLINARYLDGYRIVLTYESGERGILDMKSHSWRGVFAPLKNPAVFRAFKLDDYGDTIVWPSGADLAPEYLYEQAMAPGSAMKPLSPAARRAAVMSRRRQLRAPRYKSEVSRFFTLSIEQVFDEHAPPDFRVHHDTGSAQLAIATGKLLSGSLPAWVRRHVRPWLALHRAELAANWRRAAKGQLLRPIEPLE